MAAASFRSEDEEAQYCLGLLRHGTPSQKVDARERLAVIFTRRGMYEEAAEAYEANVRAGVRTPELFEQLSAAYRRIGETGAAEAALGEARRLRAVPRGPARTSGGSAAAAGGSAGPGPSESTPAPARPTPPAASPTPAAVSPTQPRSTSPAAADSQPSSGSPAGQAAAASTARSSAASGPPAEPSGTAGSGHDDAGKILLFPGPTNRLPSALPAVTNRLPAAQRYDPDAPSPETTADAEQRSRRRGFALPGPVLVPTLVLGLVVLPVIALALLVINPLALYLEGRTPGPTVDAAAGTPPRLKVAAGADVSWYVQAGRSVSGLWATPGLELRLDQDLEGSGATFPVMAPQAQSWGETITIVERRGQGRAHQETVLPVSFDVPDALPPSGTVLAGRIVGEVTAPRLSESSQFNTTTESLDVPVQLVVVSAPELWLDRFGNSLRMFLQDDRWLLVSIGALLSWCVLAGGAAILFRARRG